MSALKIPAANNTRSGESIGVKQLQSRDKNDPEYAQIRKSLITIAHPFPDPVHTSPKTKKASATVINMPPGPRANQLPTDLYPHTAADSNAGNNDGTSTSTFVKVLLSIVDGSVSALKYLGEWFRPAPETTTTTRSSNSLRHAKLGAAQVASTTKPQEGRVETKSIGTQDKSKDIIKVTGQGQPKTKSSVTWKSQQTNEKEDGSKFKTRDKDAKDKKLQGPTTGQSKTVQTEYQGRKGPSTSKPVAEGTKRTMTKLPAADPSSQGFQVAAPSTVTTPAPARTAEATAPEEPVLHQQSFSTPAVPYRRDKQDSNEPVVVVSPKRSGNITRDNSLRLLSPLNSRNESVFDLHPVKTNVDLNAIKVASVRDVSIPQGISAFKQTVESQYIIKKSGRNRDFIDFFARKGGTRHIGVLEQFEADFDQRTRSGLAAAPASMQTKFKTLKEKILEIAQVTAVEEEKELQDFDFCLVIEHDTDRFGIDVSQKLVQLQKTHNWAVKMVLHWVFMLQKREVISPQQIYDIAVEVLADIVVPSYAIFAQIAEYYANVIDYSGITYITTDRFLLYLRNLMETLLDELGAVGESCGKIIIRIPNLTETFVVDIMTKLYLQINYASIALSRAVESLTPIILCYALMEYKEKQNELTTTSDTSDDRQNKKTTQNSL